MSTSRLKVVLDDERAYDIRIGSGLLDEFGADLRKLTQVKKVVIITDSNVGPLYLSKLHDTLRDAGFESVDISIPEGEQSKSVEVATELWEALAHLGIGRDALIVALGGGVVGDIAGFVASTYMRGIGYVQVPTSLLAMVDSSVGGKTAINLASNKNQIGSFYQPLYVLVDLDTLATLPDEQWANGYAEIAKSAIIDGGEFYSWLHASTEALVAKDSAFLQRAVVQALSFKARVVVADEREAGLRECLNYGHTFAHALEAASGFKIAHGTAVAEGMRFAARLAVEACAPAETGGASGVESSFVEEQDILLTKLNLNPIDRVYSADELFGYIMGDKKIRSGVLRFVFAKRPGDWQIIAVDEDLVKIYIILWEQSKM